MEAAARLCRRTNMVLKAAHTFNLLDARGAISVTERAAYIGRIRNLARAVAQAYFESREAPRLPDAEGLGHEVRPRGEEGHDATLLVELFTEELPPKALKRLGETFAMHQVAEGLKARGLAPADAVPHLRQPAPAGGDGGARGR
jgi:hypothetical protein